MDDLIERVQGLPAELFNNILDFVLTPSVGEVAIDEHYKPPAQLQLNRSTREHFAAQYYGSNTIFSIRPLGHYFRSLEKWLSALPLAHRNQVGRLLVKHWTRPAAERFLAEVLAKSFKLAVSEYYAPGNRVLVIDVVVGRVRSVVRPDGGIEEGKA